MTAEQASPPSEEAAEHSSGVLPPTVDVVLLDAIAPLQLSGLPIAK